MWDHPGSGVKPVSPALAGGFFSSEPPEKPSYFCFAEKNVSGSEKVSNVPKATQNERQGQGLALGSWPLQAWHRGKTHTRRAFQHPFKSLLENTGLKSCPGGQEALALFDSQRKEIPSIQSIP